MPSLSRRNHCADHSRRQAQRKREQEAKSAANAEAFAAAGLPYPPEAGSIPSAIVLSFGGQCGAIRDTYPGVYTLMPDSKNGLPWWEKSAGYHNQIFWTGKAWQINFRFKCGRPPRYSIESTTGCGVGAVPTTDMFSMHVERPILTPAEASAEAAPEEEEEQEPVNPTEVPSFPRRRIYVDIKSASGLKNPHWLSNIKPKVVVRLPQADRHAPEPTWNGKSLKTFETNKGDGINPVWYFANEILGLNDEDPEGQLSVKIYEGMMLAADECIGQCYVDLSGLVKDKMESRETELYPKGTITIELTLMEDEPEEGEVATSKNNADQGNAVQETTPSKKADHAASVVEQFKNFDTNGDGMIQRDELVTVFSKLDPEFTADVVDEMLQAADLNQDGCISYSEFVTWIFVGDDALAKSLAYLNAKRALAYEAKEGEELFVPASRSEARLLLRPDGSFSYVPDNKARFSEGVQGVFTRSDEQITLTPEFFGEHADPYDANPLDVTLSDELLESRGPRYKGCRKMVFPETALQGCWLSPDA